VCVALGEQRREDVAKKKKKFCGLNLDTKEQQKQRHGKKLHK
jgi:hypothetical protein